MTTPSAPPVATDEATLMRRAIGLARRGEGLESLHGVIEAGGLALTRKNLPPGFARIQVYYYRSGPDWYRVIR